MSIFQIWLLCSMFSLLNFFVFDREETNQEITESLEDEKNKKLFKTEENALLALAIFIVLFGPLFFVLSVWNLIVKFFQKIF